MAKRQRALARQQERESEKKETPPPSQGQAGFVAFRREEYYEGPLLPQQIAEYDKTETGRQFLSVMMAQSQHRMQLERMVIESDIRHASWGLISAVVISLTFLAAGVGVTLAGHDWVGGATIIGSIGSLAGTFIYGTKSRREERTEKAKLMADPTKGKKKTTSENQGDHRQLPHGD